MYTRVANNNRRFLTITSTGIDIVIRSDDHHLGDIRHLLQWKHLPIVYGATTIDYRSTAD